MIPLSIHGNPKYLVSGLICIFLCALNTYKTYSQTELQIKSIHENIDWLWRGENTKPASPRVISRLVPIGDGTTLSFFGKTGKTSSGNFALLYAVTGKKQEALEWLVAVQARNEEARYLFRLYPDFTIDYATNKYLKTTLKSLNIKSVSDVSNELLVSVIKTDLPLEKFDFAAIPIEEWKSFPEDYKIPRELLKKMSPESLSKIPKNILPYLIK